MKKQYRCTKTGMANWKSYPSPRSKPVKIFPLPTRPALQSPKVIAKDKEAAYKYTMKANTVAVVSDGSAVLGLGNIGPYAA